MYTPPPARPLSLPPSTPPPVLRALILAGDHEARGQMRDAHRAVGHVDMLPAGARGAVRVHPQVVVTDANVHLWGEGVRGRGRKNWELDMG